MKKFFNILFLFLFIVPFIHSQDGIDIWTTTTESIGRVYGMAVDELNPSTMYAFGLDQGIYKTTNTGTNWNQINSGLLNTQVQAMAICKNSSQDSLCRYFLPGTNDGVYKITDGGGSWTKIINGIAEPAGTLGVQAF